MVYLFFIFWRTRFGDSRRTSGEKLLLNARLCFSGLFSSPLDWVLMASLPEAQTALKIGQLWDTVGNAQILI